MDSPDLSQTVPIHLVVTADTGDSDGKINKTKEQLTALQQVGHEGFQAVGAGFDTMISGLVRGTETMRQVVANGIDTMVIDFLKAQLRMEMAAIQSQLGITNASAAAANGSVVNWLVAEARKTGGTLAETNTRTTATIQAASAGNAADSAAAGKSITTHAASAAAAVYDDVAQIPVVGWLLAPPAAALAYGAVAAFGGMIPGLEVGAWEIPGPMLAMLHPGESVVPATFASGLRASGILGNGSAGGAAATPVNVTFQVSALDAGSVSAFFNTHGTTIAKTLAAVQNRNPSLRPGY